MFIATNKSSSFININIIIYDILFNYHFLLWSKIPICTIRISMIWRSSIELVPAVIYNNGNEYVAIINWVIFQWWVISQQLYIWYGYDWKNPYFDNSKEGEGFQKQCSLFSSSYNKFNLFIYLDYHIYINNYMIFSLECHALTL